jgi:hypothetical protein
MPVGRLDRATGPKASPSVDHFVTSAWAAPRAALFAALVDELVERYVPNKRTALHDRGKEWLHSNRYEAIGFSSRSGLN